MTDMLRIECPVCQTSYTSARCGIALMPEQLAVSTVVCLVCKSEIDVRIEPKYITDEQGWFAKYILRREPSITLKGHEITSITVR